MIAHAGPAPRVAAAALIAVAGAAWWVTIANAREMSDMLDGFVKVGRAMPWHISAVLKNAPRFKANSITVAQEVGVVEGDRRDDGGGDAVQEDAGLEGGRPCRAQ